MVAVAYQYFIVLQRWRYIDDLPRSNFDRAANFTVKTINDMDVTYYSNGNLAEVLKSVCYLLTFVCNSLCDKYIYKSVVASWEIPFVPAEGRRNISLRQRNITITKHSRKTTRLFMCRQA